MANTASLKKESCIDEAIQLFFFYADPRTEEDCY